MNNPKQFRHEWTTSVSLVRQLTFEMFITKQNIVRVWRLGSDLITPHRYVYMRYWGVMIKYIPPRQSLQVDAGVVVGLKEQIVMLVQGGSWMTSQRERREIGSYNFKSFMIELKTSWGIKSKKEQNKKNTYVTQHCAVKSQLSSSDG